MFPMSSAYAGDRVVQTSTTTPSASNALTYTHDDLGRITAKGASAEVLAYDLSDHLTSVTRTAGPSEKLWYGPAGELVMRQQGQQVTWNAGAFATVTGQLPAGCQAAGCGVDVATVVVDTHVLLGTTKLASVRSSKVGASYPVSQTLYYYRDRLGSIVATSTAGGFIGVRLRWGPYGVLEKVVGANAGDGECRTTPTCPELGYTGALRLTGSLVYLNARVYDAGLRRFLTADSVDLARYTYTGGDPSNRIDPSGLRWNVPEVSEYVMQTHWWPDSNFWLGSGGTQGAELTGLHSSYWDEAMRLAQLADGLALFYGSDLTPPADAGPDGVSPPQSGPGTGPTSPNEFAYDVTVYVSTTNRDAAGEVGQAPTDRYGSATLAYWDGTEWHYSQYGARSGSFMSNGTYKYNPANPGEYKGDWDSLRNRSKGTLSENVSMYDDRGLGYSINITAVNAPGPTQTQLEIHPDGGKNLAGAFTPNNGTAACIGINTRDSQKFLMELGHAVSLSGNAIFRVVVFP